MKDRTMYNQNCFLMSNYTRVGGEVFRTDLLEDLTSSSEHTLTYPRDLSTIKYKVDVDGKLYPIYIVLTLRFHQEALIKKILAEIKASGLYEKTIKIFLRFEEEPNRKICNFCKLNFDKVEIHSSSNYDVMDFLEMRFKEGDKYILCYDLREQEQESLQDLLMLHYIVEWKYGVETLIEGKRITGLFPCPSSHDYWFHAFWIKSDTSRPFRSIKADEKHVLLECSNGEWFKDMGEIENSVFVYESESETEEKKTTATTASFPPSFSSNSGSTVIFPNRSATAVST